MSACRCDRDGTGCLRARDRRCDVSLDQRLCGLNQGGVPARERNDLGEDLDEPGLRHAVRVERSPEIGPRDRGHDRLERNPGDRRVPDRASAEREAEGSDLGVRDVRPGSEPVEEVARILRLGRAVEPELATRAAGATGVAGKRGEAELRHRRADRLHVGVRLTEPVEEDDAGPTAGRRGAARDDVRTSERSRVRGRDGDLRPARCRRGSAGADERCGKDGNDDAHPTHEAHATAPLRCPQWIRVP